MHTSQAFPDANGEDDRSVPDERSKWNRRYRERSHSHGDRPSSFLLDSLPPATEGRALVLAAGEGRNAVALAEHGYRVLAIDIAEAACARTRRLARTRGVELDIVAADLRSWELGSERFAIITSFYYLERSLFARIPPALAPGGLLVLEHFSIDHPRVASFGPRSSSLLLQPNEALQAAVGLRLVHYEDRIVHVDEGGHQGPAALVRMVARKP